MCQLRSRLSSDPWSDRDHYIDGAPPDMLHVTCYMLEDVHADPAALIEMFRHARGGRDGIEIRGVVPSGTQRP